MGSLRRRTAWLLGGGEAGGGEESFREKSHPAPSDSYQSASHERCICRVPGDRAEPAKARAPVKSGAVSRNF